MGIWAVTPAVLDAGITPTTWTVLGVLAIVVLIALSGFFSSSEIAMFSLARHRVDSMYEEGIDGSATLKKLKSDPHRLLVTILVGNNLVNIAMSAIATGLLGFYLSRGQAVMAATFGITAIVLLFGEIAPKSYAVENTESWALAVAKPLELTKSVLYPLVVFFDDLSRIINRVTGGRSAIETSYVTRDEIQTLIETGEREGVIDEEERELLQRIFRFNNTIAKEVMTPRLDMTAVSNGEDLESALQTCVRSGHGRVPVYESDLDKVIGIVQLRDIVREHVYGENDNADLEDLVQPTLHIPESKNVDDLLTDMQEERVEMVIVIDEFGTTEGLITTEDIIEEIVGEILQDEEEHPIEHIDEQTVLVNGEVNIEEVNEALDIDLPEGEEFETIAGFIFNRAGRLVEEAESFTFENVELAVESVENTRIMKARVTKHPTTEEVPSTEQPAVEEL